ncbi:MAG: Fe-S cluster assembly protein SufD [Hyphomicrobiales bacterium]|nr:Fe-S cluster assembly protein SufD [Hyphomicrobiales bacterium]
MSAKITPIRSAAESALIDRFPALKASLPGLPALRENAFAAFAAAGLPTRRVEAWKYTDLRAAMREAAPLAARPNDAEITVALKGHSPLAGQGVVTLSFVNGHHVATAGALPAGVSITPLAKALAGGHPLLSRIGALKLVHGDLALSLNTAFMTDGAIIHVAEGVTVDGPIALRFVTSGATAVATAARVLMVAEAGSHVMLVESHEGQGALAHQPNTALEIIAGDKAVVSHVRLGLNSAGAVALSTLTADLGSETSLTSVNVALQGAVTRHQAFVRFSGGDARAQINGATLLSGTQHADSTLVVEHAAEPGGESRELFRTIIDDEASGVFQGKIIVQPHAQKTDGRMASNAVLLSESAAMYNKPELEIFADDVACAHGATCGALDDELLFYLMSRGISKAEAEALMIESFVGASIDFIDHEPIREILHALVRDWLQARAARLNAEAPTVS